MAEVKDERTNAARRLPGREIVLAIIVVASVVLLLALRYALQAPERSVEAAEQIAQGPAGGKLRDTSRAAAALDEAVAKRKPRPSQPRSTLRASEPGMSVPTTERGPSGATVTFRHDFTSGRIDPSMFTKLENVESTAEGFRLAKAADGSHTIVGVLQSVPIPTEIPANAVGVHWRETVPEGTEIKVEVSSSSNGGNWTEWQTVEVDDDSEVSPVFPDGRPNPNFGDTIGTLISRTDNRAAFYRYRVTLSTEQGDKSPTLQRVALTYQDSTDEHSSIQPEKEPVNQ